MPFKSKSQQRFMFSQKPKLAKEWASKYGVSKDLPESVSNELTKRMTRKGKKK